jgi:hypothetical protein
MFKSIQLLTFLSLSVFNCYGQEFDSSINKEDSKICKSICIDSIVPLSSNENRTVNVYIRTHDLYGEWLNSPILYELLNEKGEAITDGFWEVTRFLLEDNSTDFFPVNLTSELPPLNEITARFGWDNGECLIISCQINAPK